MTTLYEPETLHFHDMQVADMKRLNASNSAYYGRLCLAKKRRDDFLINNLKQYKFVIGNE